MQNDKSRLLLRNHLTTLYVLFCISGMINFSKRIIFGLLFLFGLSELQAKHIIGGDMYYECIFRDSARKQIQFRITMKLYRDCSNPEGALFDTDAKFGIYEKLPDGRYRFVRDFLNQRYLEPIRDIDPDASNPCLIVPSSVCVQEATYQFVTGNLPILTAGSYLVSYQRCCRNETISNIDRPGDAGAALILEITSDAQRECNNSPRFKSFPPVVICVNNPLIYDHSAADAEGDSIVYSFCSPLTSGGQDGTQNGRNSCVGVTPHPSLCLPPYDAITFRAPLYSTSQPMGGNPVIQIDPFTGLITGTPQVQGQFVVGVCIKEYRRGVLLTETRRDFQFNVTYCEPKVFPKIQADSTIASGQTFVVNSCGSNTVDFFNRSTDENFIFSYRWEFNMLGNIEVQNSKNAQFNFPQLGAYQGKMVVNQGTQCADSLYILVNIFPDISARFNYQYDTCIAGPVVFLDQSSTGSSGLVSWNWNFSGAGSSTLKDPSFLFSTPGLKAVQLQVRDVNGCIADTVANVRYYPVPPLLIIDPNQSIGCSPLKVCLNNLSTPIDTSYSIVWDFGDGSFGKDISPCHTYENGGIYSLKLEVTSPIGCFTERRFDQLIQVNQSPTAKFSYTPDKLSIFNKQLSLSDQSVNAVSRRWLINQKDIFSQGFVFYEFQDTGVQQIQLVAIAANGCTDTLVQYIDVEPLVTLFMPNAFSPNGDGTNESFQGVGYTYGMTDFKMTIWDRWGGLVFQTNNPDDSWNGRKENNGENLPNGVYVYVVSYRTPRNQLIENKGFVTIIR